MLAACGMPPAMVNPANAQALREAHRQWHMGTVTPIARLIESELSRRLDADIRLTLNDYGRDLAGRAQAFAKLVGAEWRLNRLPRLAAYWRPTMPTNWRRVAREVVRAVTRHGGLIEITRAGRSRTDPRHDHRQRPVRTVRDNPRDPRVRYERV